MPPESATAVRQACVSHIPHAKFVILSKYGERIAYFVTADRGKDMSSQIFGCEGQKWACTLRLLAS